METEATKVLTWELTYVPGLLQVEPYIRALFQSGNRRTENRLQNDVAARLFRQDRLTDLELPLELHVVIDEGILTSSIGANEVMLMQLAHLVKVAALPTATLQVMPHGPSAHPGMRSSFDILVYEEEDPDIFHVQHLTGSYQGEDLEELSNAKSIFGKICSGALSPESSVSLIERVLSSLG